jgi:hypothetical protein
MNLQNKVWDILPVNATKYHIHNTKYKSSELVPHTAGTFHTCIYIYLHMTSAAGKKETWLSRELHYLQPTSAHTNDTVSLTSAHLLIKCIQQKALTITNFLWAECFLQNYYLLNKSRNSLCIMEPKRFSAYKNLLLDYNNSTSQPYPHIT